MQKEFIVCSCIIIMYFVSPFAKTILNSREHGNSSCKYKLMPGLCVELFLKLWTRSPGTGAGQCICCVPSGLCEAWSSHLGSMILYFAKAVSNGIQS